MGLRVKHLPYLKSLLELVVMDLCLFVMHQVFVSVCTVQCRECFDMLHNLFVFLYVWFCWKLFTDFMRSGVDVGVCICLCLSGYVFT